MKLNRTERWFVNSPLRRLMQYFVVQWFRRAYTNAVFGQVLEIGCGRGAGGRMIRETFDPGRLYLMDIDPSMVQRAATQMASAGREGGVDLFVADATFLPFMTASMDTVFGFGFLHHVSDWRSGMAEIARVLKPGGTYFLEELYPGLYQNWLTRRLLVHPESGRFNSLDLKVALTDAGLSLQQTFELKRLGILGIAVKYAG